MTTNALTTGTLATAALLLGASTAPAAERADAHLECAQTAQTLVYECTVALASRSRQQPIGGAEVVLKADMPSMPMAHNIKPARAAPTGKPGEYKARLELEMHGEWLVTIDVAGPLRDRVLVKRKFEPNPSPAAGPAIPAPATAGKPSPHAGHKH